MTATSESAPVSPLPLAAPGELSGLVDGDRLLDRDGLKAFMRVSEFWVATYTRRKEDPLPWIGTPGVRRILVSDLIAWLRRNSSAK